MDPEQGECYLPGKTLLMKTEELRKIFSEDGLYAMRVENGGITHAALILGDHVVLSTEAFIEYLERLSFEVVRE